MILFGSKARGTGRWDSDADILVVMPFEGRLFANSRDIRRACKPGFRVDLLIRRPEDIEPRYRRGDPIIREALDHGEVLIAERNPEQSWLNPAVSCFQIPGLQSQGRTTLGMSRCLVTIKEAARVLGGVGGALS